MSKRIVIIQGHPDSKHPHLGHALAKAYSEGANEAGHEVRHITVGELDFPLLRSKIEWEAATYLPSIMQSQESIRWANHLVIVYPLWLGSMPALLKAFLEQVFRPGFAISKGEPGKIWKKLLTGRSAHIVVTMGMPALIYRWFFRAHSLKSLERNILGFSGIGPIRASVIGMVESDDDARRRKWIQKMRKFGAGGR